MSDLASKEKERHADTEGKLILFVSEPPTNVDVEAKDAVRDYDPSVEVIALKEKPSVRTPRLDATEYNRSIYHGIESILSFIRMRRRRLAHAD